MTKAIAAVLLLSTATAACTPPRQLPPPVAPERLLPPLLSELVAQPPAPGQQRVALAPDEPSLIDEPIGTVEGVDFDGFPIQETAFRTVCQVSPCVTDLTPGAHQLRLTAIDDPSHSGIGTVNVGDQPVAYNYALGRSASTPHLGAGIGAITGGTIGVMGGVFAIAFSTTPTSLNAGAGPNLSSGWVVGGLSAIVIGGVALALGIHWISDPGTTQDGTGVQWTPSPPTPATSS